MSAVTKVTKMVTDSRPGPGAVFLGVSAQEQGCGGSAPAWTVANVYDDHQQQPTTAQQPQATSIDNNHQQQ